MNETILWASADHANPTTTTTEIKELQNENQLGCQLHAVAVQQVQQAVELAVEITLTVNTAPGTTATSSTWCQVGDLLLQQPSSSSWTHSGSPANDSL
jgi:hypothetical protein